METKCSSHWVIYYIYELETQDFTLELTLQLRWETMLSLYRDTNVYQSTTWLFLILVSQ